MDRGKVEEDRGSKETDGCPLTGCEQRKENRVHGGAECVIGEGAD
jgi:hypothetical protein